MGEAQLNKPYQPISCELHSQYELAIMHKNKLCLSWLKEGETVTEKNITPVDVVTKNKAEFLVVNTSSENNVFIRLDHIVEMRVLN